MTYNWNVKHLRLFSILFSNSNAHRNKCFLLFSRRRIIGDGTFAHAPYCRVAAGRLTWWVCFEINQEDTLPEETFRVEKMTEDGEETKAKVRFKVFQFDIELNGECILANHEVPWPCPGGSAQFHKSLLAFIGHLKTHELCPWKLTFVVCIAIFLTSHFATATNRTVSKVKVNKFVPLVSPSGFQAARDSGRPEHPLRQRRHPARCRRVSGGRTASLPGHKSVLFTLWTPECAWF